MKNVHEHVSPQDPWDWAYLPTFTMNRNSPMQYIYIYVLKYIYLHVVTYHFMVY